MGTGEGTNEMPEHLLQELRKRPIYYKSEAPKEIQVRIYARGLYKKMAKAHILVVNRHADILCIMVDFVLGKTWLRVLSTARLYPETTLEGPSIRKMLLLHPHPTQPQQIQTRNTLAK